MKTKPSSTTSNGTPASTFYAASGHHVLPPVAASKARVSPLANRVRVSRFTALATLVAALGASACGGEESDTATSDLEPAIDAGNSRDAATVGNVEDVDAGDVTSNGGGDTANGASADAGRDDTADDDTADTDGDGATDREVTSSDSSGAAPADTTGNETSQSADTGSPGTVGSSLDTTGSSSDDSTAIPIMESDVIMAAEALMWGSHFPGMALATFDASGVTWATGLGFADSALTRPVTSDTSFWLASVTKPFTGLALLRAIEETDLNLETDVASLLEANAAFTLATTEPVTVRDLVTHHSSIRDSSAYLCSYYVGTAEEHQSLANLLELGAGCDEYQPVALDEYLRSYLSADGGYYQASHFADDAGGFAYSNVGAALAGYAVELATDKSLAAYAREEIFAPLGLDHTSYDIADLDIAEVATPTRWDAEQQVNVDYPLYELSTWPEGGLRSSVADLSKLSAALLAGGTLGETPVLSSESVTTAFSSLESADVGDVGVFWLVGNDTSYAADGSTRRLAGENGGDPGAATMVVLDLDNDFGIVILANGELADQAAADRTNELARLLYRFAEQRANAAD